MPAADLVASATEEDARVDLQHARKVADRIVGLTVSEAVRTLRFAPGLTCPPLARVVDDATRAAAGRGIEPVDLVVAGASAEEGPDIVRVRRHSHGHADWIRTPTSTLTVLLRRRLQVLPSSEERTP